MEPYLEAFSNRFSHFMEASGPLVLQPEYDFELEFQCLSFLNILSIVCLIPVCQ